MPKFWGLWALFFTLQTFAELRSPAVLPPNHVANRTVSDRRVASDPIAKRLFECRKALNDSGLERELREIDGEGGFFFHPPVRIKEDENPFYVIRQENGKFTVLEGDFTKVGIRQRAVFTGSGGLKLWAGILAFQGNDILTLQKLCPGDKPSHSSEVALKEGKDTDERISRVSALYIMQVLDEALASVTNGAANGSAKDIQFLKKNSDAFLSALSVCYDRFYSTREVGSLFAEKIVHYEDLIRNLIKPRPKGGEIINPVVKPE